MRRAVALLLLVPAPAIAAEAFVGVAAHDVALGISACCYERGADVQFGVRSAPLARLLKAEVRGQAFGSVSTNGGVDSFAVGVQLRFKLPIIGVYIAPGFGAAVQDGSLTKYQATPSRLYLGSRFLFEPEIVIGYHVGGPFAVEASYTHISHAYLGGPQNPGLDTLGLRGVVRF